jgi:hypothetical protein
MSTRARDTADVVEDVNVALGSKLPYSYGTATPTPDVEGFVWFDENETPPAPQFWDGSAFQALGGAGGGKILQIVRATDSTDRTTTSTSHVDANISVTITPQKSDSALVIIWSAFYGAPNSGYIWTQITDASDNTLSGAQGGFLGSSNANGLQGTVTLVGYVSSAGSSAVTYKGRFRLFTGTGSAGVFNSLSTGQLYAIEVGA